MEYRSYYITADKIAAKLAFRPKRDTEDPMRDLRDAYRGGQLPNNTTHRPYHDVKTPKSKRAA